MAGRTITRFTRTYEEFDPDGAGGGPPTWILASPGSGSGNSGAVVGGLRALLSATLKGASLPAGTAVAMDAAGELILADPNAPTTAVCVGLLLQAAAGGSSAIYTSDGGLSLADWSAVTGGILLQPGVRYFLDPAKPGGLTTICPSQAGVYAAPIGVALSGDLLEVEINLPVRQ